MPIMKLSSVVHQTRNDSKWHPWQSDHQFAPSFGCPILRKLSASGGFAFWPSDQGLCLWTQNPIMGSCYALAMVRAPPLFFPSLRIWVFPVKSWWDVSVRMRMRYGPARMLSPGPTVALNGPEAVTNSRTLLLKFDPVYCFLFHRLVLYEFQTSSSWVFEFKLELSVTWLKSSPRVPQLDVKWPIESLELELESQLDDVQNFKSLVFELW